MGQKIRIIFRGEIVAGEVESVVKQRAAQLFKASPEQVARLFSGKSIVVRKDLPEEEGPRYQERLEKAGMRVYIERMRDKTTPPPPPPPPARPVPPRVPFPEIVTTEDPGPAASPEIPQAFPADLEFVAAQQKTSVYGASKASLLFPPQEEPAAPAIPPGLSLIEEDTAQQEMECPKCGVRQTRRTFCHKCGVDMPSILKAREAEKALLADPGRVLAELHSAGEVVEGKDFRIFDEDEAQGAKGKSHNK